MMFFYSYSFSSMFRVPSTRFYVSAAVRLLRLIHS